VLAHVVVLRQLIELRHHLDRSVEQVHLVDKEVAEDAGAVDDDVDARAAELLDGEHLELVDAAKRVGHGLDAHHPEHLQARGPRAPEHG
jgi:hypothetical protein